MVFPAPASNWQADPEQSRLTVQCPQCREPNDDRARFCLACGAELHRPPCASCQHTLPEDARFCPACGHAVEAETAPVSPVGPSTVPRTDPAEVLLAARDDTAHDGDVDADDEMASPEEMELVERIRGERSRRRRSRTVLGVVMAVAVLVIGVALLATQRGPREERAASVSAETAASADGTSRQAQPGTTPASGASEEGGTSEILRAGEAERTRSTEPSATSRSTTARGTNTTSTAPPDDAAAPALPPRATSPPPSAEARGREAASAPTRPGEPEVSASPPRRGAPEVAAAPTGRPTPEAAAPPRRNAPPEPSSPGRSGQSDPAALPGTATARPPDVRVDVKQVPGAPAGAGAPRTVDYTVRVSNAGGGPVSGADVRLRGLTTDGVLVEAQLDPGSEPGVYRGLVPVTPRGPNNLTVRVVRPDGVVEVPVGGSQITR
jgi:hypothetical protein